MNAFFLISVITILLGSFIIGLIRNIDNDYMIDRINAVILAVGIAAVVSLPFSIRNWTFEKNQYLKALSAEGISYSETSIPFNVPFILKQIVIDDGADLYYYQLLPAPAGKSIEEK